MLVKDFVYYCFSDVRILKKYLNNGKVVSEILFIGCPENIPSDILTMKVGYFETRDTGYIDIKVS